MFCLNKGGKDTGIFYFLFFFLTGVRASLRSLGERPEIWEVGKDTWIDLLLFRTVRSKHYNVSMKVGIDLLFLIFGHFFFF